MRKLGTGVLAAAVVLAGPVPLAGAHGGGHGHGDDGGDHRVVADGFDNPRQLSWSQDHGSLVVAEAGRGGDRCAGGQCTGATGAVSLIERPWRRTPAVSTVAEGFLSMASPDGSFAVGSNGADATDVDDQYVVAGHDAARPPMQGGSLLVTGTEETGEKYLVPFADLQKAEEELNPDTAQIESNPYAVLFVDEDPDDAPDGYALVADAAANTVWKVEPDFSTQTEDAPPEYEVTAWATWPTTSLPGNLDDPAGPAEFVPTALAADRRGNVYVGGLGSERAGEASVVKFSADGEELERWDGFTAITGVAVDRHHLYVSQLFGPAAPMPPGQTPADEAPPAAAGLPGQVIVVDRHDEEAGRRAVDVPFPAGLASDGGSLYAAVNSLAPAGGIAAGPANPFGAVGGGAVWELDLSDAYPVEPVETAAPEPAPGG